MVRRSLLFSPGDRPEMMRKAPSTGADTVVFDLEDAVAPARKDEARAAVNEVLTDPAFDPDVEVGIRVNAGLKDVVADVAALDPDARLETVMVPKVSKPGDVEAVADVLEDRGLSVPILALVETAAGVFGAREVAATPPTAALCFGAEDLSADIGATRTSEGTEVLYAREHTVLAARAAGVGVLDTVYTDFEDTEGLAAESRFAATLGFDGKAAIHPAQVPVINEAFTPDDDAVAWAERVVQARKAADRDGRGAFEVDGEMIDPPLVARAERILAKAEAAADDGT